jgi:hypothetical protein
VRKSFEVITVSLNGRVMGFLKINSPALHPPEAKF